MILIKLQSIELVLVLNLLNDNKCFQYATTVALSYGKINNNPEKISKIRPFIDDCGWTEIDFPSNQKDWKNLKLITNQLH